MDIIRHRSTNLDLDAPPDWDQGVNPCETLPVVVESEPQTSRTVMSSFWKPSSEELALLNAGLPVILSVWAETAEQHPVVAVHVNGSIDPEDFV